MLRLLFPEVFTAVEAYSHAEEQGFASIWSEPPIYWSTDICWVDVWGEDAEDDKCVRAQ